MPLYEYICSLCRRPFTVLIGVTTVSDNSTCPHCGSMHATRRVTRFVSRRSEDHALDALLGSNPQENGDDASAMREWSTELGKAAGQDLGSDFEEYIDSAQEAEGD